MTEPTLDRKQTWEQFIADRMQLRNELELLLPTSFWHERERPEGIKDQLSLIRAEIGFAMMKIEFGFETGEDFDGEVW